VLANDVGPGYPISAVPALPYSNYIEGGVIVLNADGGFTFVPEPKFNGSTTFTYRHRYDTPFGPAYSNYATVTIAVSAVNDAPSFVKAPGPDKTADDDDGVRSFDNWATDISAGPPDESAQTLTFQVTNDRNDLFTVQPSIDATTGRLTFTSLPTSAAQPSSPSLRDDGGTANGGDDTSDSQTFTIEIMKPNIWTNTKSRYNVNSDSVIDAQDFNLIAAYLNAHPYGEIPTDAGIGPVFYDVDADGWVTPTDAATLQTVITQTAIGDSYSTSQNSQLATSAQDGVLSNDYPVDGHPLTAVLDIDAEFGDVTMNADGSFTYTPDSGFTGNDSFVYYVIYTTIYGTTRVNSATVTIQVS
jgi:hypothetical protein